MCNDQCVVWMVHVAVNKYDFEKVNILEYAFGEGGGGHQKAYAVYAFINVDNCERPLRVRAKLGLGLKFDPNNLLTLTIATKLTLTLTLNPNPPN